MELMLQPTLRLMLQQTLRPMLLAMLLTTQPTLATSRETPPQTRDTMQELNLLRSRPIAQKEANDTV
jgi:hypothetical protein